MREKFLFAILLIAVFASASYCAVSDDVYVRKDVFEVHIQNINSTLERIMVKLDKIENDITNLSDKVSALSERMAKLEGRVDGLDYKLGTLETVVYWGFAILTTVIAIAGILPTTEKFLRNIRKPQLTIEDGERLIDLKMNVKPTVTV
ncbi:MAG: hypothetical protein IJP41_04015 [Synergistaceae bacterium]|nr:hypothetical protein [Synergistaceae bacterium]